MQPCGLLLTWDGFKLAVKAQKAPYASISPEPLGDIWFNSEQNDAKLIQNYICKG